MGTESQRDSEEGRAQNGKDLERARGGGEVFSQLHPCVLISLSLFVVGFTYKGAPVQKFI